MPTPLRASERSGRLPAVGAAAAPGAAAALLLAALAGAIAAAAAGSAVGTCLALAVGVVAELGLAAEPSPLPEMLRRYGAGRPVRTAAQMLAVAVLAGRCAVAGSVVAGAAVTAALVIGVAVVGEVARAAVVQMRQPPLLTRNLALGDVELPAPPMAAAMDARGADSAPALVAAIGLAVTIHTGGVAAAAVGLAIAAAAAVAFVGLLAPTLLGLAKPGMRQLLTDAAMEAVAALQPEVVLYFAASAEETYQVRMWVEPLARLGRRTLVLVRSHDVFDALADLPLPTAATPYNGIVASLPLPPRIAALFVTHTGNNLSMLRRPEARTVFIGHGDSDKPDSVNPFARVYDEVWVAGPLGRRRYANAEVGVSDAAIVEIGRPQVVTEAAAEPAEPPVVVYAPTWEGWGDDPHHSSLAHIGPDLVARLVAVPDIRVRYRPHPLTGRRSAALRDADRRVRALVAAVPPDEELARTLAPAAALIGDVSSVLTEFLPYDRPYAVVDTRGAGAAALAREHPTVAGGFVLSERLDGLDDLVDAVRGGLDPTAAARRMLLHDALGDPTTSQQRFAAAVGRVLEHPHGR